LIELIQAVFILTAVGEPAVAMQPSSSVQSVRESGSAQQQRQRRNQTTAQGCNPLDFQCGATMMPADAPAFQPMGSGGGGDLMRQLANSATAGAGRLNDGPYCYRAVKKIVAHALGANLGCVRGILSAGSAFQAGGDLQRAGFRNDMGQCRSPGAIRVYRGTGSGPLAGDRHGHVEVVGSDGRYHHFTSSNSPIDQTMPGRRILTGCYVPDATRVSQGPLGRCRSAYGSSGNRTTPAMRRQVR